jgi:hypothetical protein
MSGEQGGHLVCPSRPICRCGKVRTPVWWCTILLKSHIGLCWGRSWGTADCSCMSRWMFPVTVGSVKKKGVIILSFIVPHQTLTFFAVSDMFLNTM